MDRLRRLLAPAAFPGLVLAAWIALYVNVVSGALVRVTDSGLGCPDWPACNGRAVPAFSGHAVLEYGNRILAFGVIVISVLLAVNAWKTQRDTNRRWWLASLAVGGGTFAQGPLGGITVLVDLHPIAVMTHFMLAIVIVAVATVLLVEVRGLAPPGSPAAPWLRLAAPLLALWTLALITSGAVVTMSGTHPGSADVPRLWNLLDAAYLHVRIAVSFVVLLALFLFALARIGAPPRGVPRLAWAVVGLTATQVVIGEVQWRNELPWWLVLAHVATAALLWTAVVALCRVLLPARAEGIAPATVAQAQPTPWSSTSDRAPSA